MRIAIDLQAISNRKTGLGVYVENLWQNLKKLDAEWLPIRIIKKDLSTPFRILWDQAGMPFVAKIKKPDILFIPAFSVPFLYPGKTLVTVHDLIPLVIDQKFSFSAKIYWQKILPLSFKKASHLIAISECTKKDLMYFLKIPPEKITVIPEAPSPIFKPEKDQNLIKKILDKFQINSPFILSVGTLEPRKNYPRLIRAFAYLNEPDINLIIVGKKGWRYKEIFHTVAQYKLEKRVKFLNYITDEELMVLYNQALFFVFVSLYEGFGLPLLEALACGCASISSSVSSLPEVGGEAVLYVDPQNTQEIKERMKLLIQNKELRESLKQKALKQAQKFSWKKTADQTFKVIEKIAQI